MADKDPLENLLNAFALSRQKNAHTHILCTLMAILRLQIEILQLIIRVAIESKCKNFPSSPNHSFQIISCSQNSLIH